VEAPKDLNAPPRVDAEDPDAKKLKMNMTGGMGPPGKQGKDVIGAVSKRQASNTKMKDQELLAFACRRANKTRSESLAYYSMGVLHDNEKEYSKAVLCYEQYLQACRGAGDAKGEQLALNSIGIALHNMGEYDRAIDVHSQHREVSDIPGKFVAHTNIGIAFMELKDLEQASLNHRQVAKILSPSSNESHSATAWWQQHTLRVKIILVHNIPVVRNHPCVFGAHSILSPIHCAAVPVALKSV
jgi:tetratricopeptide (TPR) repeat protein